MKQLELEALFSSLLLEKDLELLLSNKANEVHTMALEMTGRGCSTLPCILFQNVILGLQ